jgi:Uma2 family endonuclease
VSVVPDWVCEILSPSSAAFDRERKLPLYARASVAHAWLVDPIARTLEVLAARVGAFGTVESYRGAARVRSEPFAAVEIDLSELWAR